MLFRSCSWEFGDDCDTRTILKVEKLYDVSPVTYPAYESTSVSARGKEDYTEMKNKLDLEKKTEANRREAFGMRHQNFKLKNQIK